MTSSLRASWFAAVALVIVASWTVACSSDDGKPSGGTSGTSGSSGTDAATEAAVEPVDAGVEAAVDGSGPLKKAAENCTKSEECESNICFAGGNQSYCSIACNAANGATVCVAPFTGTCNMKGFCKRD